MKIGVSPLERAFQLARSGRVGGLSDLKQALRSEGYSIVEIDGPAIHKQLRALIKSEREKALAAGNPAEGLDASNDE